MKKAGNIRVGLKVSLSFRTRSYHRSYKTLWNKDGPDSGQNYSIWTYCFAKANQLEYSPWLHVFPCSGNEITEKCFINTSKFRTPVSGVFAKLKRW